MTVAVLFHFLSPYHVARLEAAARRMDVVALELSGHTLTHGWTPVPGGRGFQRLTLFAQHDTRAGRRPDLLRRLNAALVDCHPAVFCVPGWSEGVAAFALQWCTHHQVPAVVLSESTAWDQCRRSWKEWVKRRVVRLFSASLVGGWPQADYVRRLGMPRDRIFLGYNAVDTGYFAWGADKARRQEAEVRRGYGLPAEYFLASARFVGRKNLSRLLQAYARYRELALNDRARITDHEPWDLVLLGDGPLRGTLDAQCSTLDLRSHVHMPGFKQYGDLPAYYGLASAFVHASTAEPWGLVVNEAMASGLPVLVSNRCGCAPDLVQEGVNGFAFDPEDAEPLAHLMLRLSALNSHLSIMGAASQRIIDSWGPERFASGLKAAAEKAMQVGPPKASLPDRLLLNALIRR